MVCHFLHHVCGVVGHSICNKVMCPHAPLTKTSTIDVSLDSEEELLRLNRPNDPHCSLARQAGQGLSFTEPEAGRPGGREAGRPGPDSHPCRSLARLARQPSKAPSWGCGALQPGDMSELHKIGRWLVSVDHVGIDRMWKECWGDEESTHAKKQAFVSAG